MRGWTKNYQVPEETKNMSLHHLEGVETEGEILAPPSDWQANETMVPKKLELPPESWAGRRKRLKVL